jgi:hypothetical protein
MQPSIRPAAVLDLLLNRENPRHVSKDNQPEVIEYLLNDEEVVNLARHMSVHGINPLEVVAVFPDEDGNLIVAEGNRRICAAQLLTDPKKAPESARPRFKALAEKSRDVSQVNIAFFPDYATAQPWLQVLHDGEQDGVGRRRWKPAQKARATTSKSTDALAVALLGYAEENGIINDVERDAIRVSTATRYLANPPVRQAMGLLSMATSDKVVIDGGMGVDVFADILRNFFAGIRSGALHSRSVSKDWLEYADQLTTAFPRTGGATTSEPIEIAPSFDETADPPKAARPTKARIMPPETRFIARSAPVIAGLNKLGSFKLSSLYNSLTAIRLDEHPALLTTGAWVFLETLSAAHGQTSGDFVAYLSPQLGRLVTSKNAIKECRLSLAYISSHGNAQKHSPTFTAVDARNLTNHFQVLEPMFIGLINETIAAKGRK